MFCSLGRWRSLEATRERPDAVEEGWACRNSIFSHLVKEGRDCGCMHADGG
jgi:hypothetical protein